MGVVRLDPNRHPLIEHPNRGKRSVGNRRLHPGGRRCSTRSPRPPTSS
jgi:hypothetical protein